jgi:hypothetical protein
LHGMSPSVGRMRASARLRVSFADFRFASIHSRYSAMHSRTV